MTAEEEIRSHRTLCEFCKVKKFKIIGNFNKVEVMACGALLEYVKAHKILKLSECLYAVKSSKNELEVIYKSLGDYKDVYEFLNKVILDNNVSNVKEGGFVDPNYNAELSELSYMLNNDKAWQAVLVQHRRIKELKIKSLLHVMLQLIWKLQFLVLYAAKLLKNLKIALAANALSKLDIRTAFAELAARNKYVRPVIDDSREFNSQDACIL
ncbi:DNA mismatch repair protein MutS, core [Cinara cedri]|uniref:DNA mismatch repair protein MutS, core n=1 Tax=Cinara cedri TaxID=506608 RepID=A0A5E4NMU6_9HEMI|nr:DNA mismatch repair protein MutS, core [Cinara cedri]